MARSEEAKQLINQVYLALDEGRFADMGTFFAPEGIWLRQGAENVGPAGVAAAFSSRPDYTKVAHLISNFIVEERSDAECVCRYYMTAFRHDGCAPGSAAPSQVPFQIGRCRAIVHFDTGAPLVHRLEILEPVFKA